MTEKFYLEKPSLARKDEAIAYIQEHYDYNSEINGVGGLTKCLEGMAYEDWLIEWENRQDLKWANERGRVPAITYFLIRESDNKMIGTINIRHHLTPKMLEFGGHIGYGVRPTERRKGYNKINLYLGLLKAYELGLDKVMLDCTTENIGSNKTIQALGGILTKTDIDPSDNTLTNVYWINTEESIRKYQSIYEPFIGENIPQVLNK